MNIVNLYLGTLPPIYVIDEARAVIAVRLI